VTGADRDRTTVRRALVAGSVVTLALGVPLAVAVVATGGTGAAVLAVTLLAVTAGGVVATAWLLLAAGLDLRAGAAVGRRRVVWTVAVATSTFAAQVLAAAAASLG